ncbi:hypothetical protein ACTOB_001171 [Actinoplanes oblitus]|uniref:Uncharacterized protein n=1 Tax=Actinoplanes oblitus TaxID=3040509 RepID=A0ABY8WID3_9ACTN|nr:hypothetical protein [Actinoplanes oblitus]WIM97631.1 hypothetical protein ACTOB_001171 [Actinoplanes oblitus]
MSTPLLRLIPTDPHWEPEPAAIERARALLGRLLPDREIGHQAYRSVFFIDQGENFEEVRCPRCRTVLDVGWWGERVNRAAEHGFADLAVRCPSCDLDTTLNDLDYRLPAGFARFELTVADPPPDGLPAAGLSAIGQALGHEIRAVLTRY